MAHSNLLSLKDNFAHFMAKIDACTLTEEDERSYRASIAAQIDAADRLAHDTSPNNTHLFLNARVVLGFGEDNDAPILAFPKPKPRTPAPILDLVEPA